MRPILLRDEQPPDDVVVVVRGGLLTPDSVRMTVQRCRREYGFLGLSVYAAVGVTVAGLVATVSQLGPDRYRRLRLSTFGAWHVAGFPLWPPNLFPHFSIVLPDLQAPTLARLEACFGPPQASPALSGG
jgi:hypothetical protein